LIRARGRLVLFAFTLVLLGAADRASAQTGVQLGTPPKGIIGLGLFGAELGIAVPAAFRVKNPWILTATGVAGGAGGALAGFYLLDKRDNGTTRALSITFVALGLAGFVPTTLLVVRATRYVPPDDPPAEASLADAGGGLLRVSRGRLGLGIPAVTVSRVPSLRDVRETQFALLSGRF
jgi:ABC-type uncharacterized transport system permease subunit